MSKIDHEIIKEELDKTGKSYDWKFALCIDEQTLSMTYKFSETMAQEFERRKKDGGKSI